MKIGYARVSSADQSLDIQMDQLRDHGCEKIFCEKISGTKKENREQLNAMLQFIREGDVLVVTRLDRFARSLTDTLNLLRDLGARGIGFTVIQQPELNTETPMGKVLLAMVGCFAEFENDTRRARTREGMERAKAAGKQCAPPRKMDRDVAIREIKAMQAKGMKSYSIGKRLNYSAKHVERLVPDGWAKQTQGGVN